MLLCDFAFISSTFKDNPNITREFHWNPISTWAILRRHAIHSFIFCSKYANEIDNIALWPVRRCKLKCTIHIYLNIILCLLYLIHPKHGYIQINSTRIHTYHVHQWVRDASTRWCILLSASFHLNYMHMSRYLQPM